MKPCLALAACLLFIAPGIGSAIEVKNKKGQAMDVEVLSYTESSGNLKIKRNPDGAVFNLKIGIFDKPSQEAIRKAAPKVFPALDIKVSTGKRRERLGDSSYMKKQTVTAGVKVKNDTRDIDLEECTFTILLIARNMKRYDERDVDGAKILSKQSFKKSIPAGQLIEYEFKGLETTYDSDRDNSNIGGWEFDGYLFAVQDGKGEIVDAKSSIGHIQASVLEDPVAIKDALKLKEGDTATRNLVPQ